MKREQGKSLLAWALIAVGVALACGVLALVFQDNIFRWAIKPPEPFQVYEPPAPPDYSNPTAWALRPDRPLSDDDPKADVFFVHPTTHYGGRQWNAAIDAPVATRRLEREALPNFAEPFRGIGRIYAPRYRQATLFAFLSRREDARAARMLAYADVKRAFEAFDRVRGEDRPFFLVGVGQGGAHALRLLRDEIAGTPRADLLVAAYLIDTPVPLDLFQTDITDISACAAAAQTKCAASWNAFEADERQALADLRLVRDTIGPGDTFAPVDERPLLCVNPLTWRVDGSAAPAKLHKGATAAIGLEPGATPPVTPGLTGAQCVDGVLIVDPKTKSAFAPRGGFGARYKTASYNLFYADVSDNAAERLDAWRPLKPNGR